MGWKIKKYDEYCKTINDKITDLCNRAIEEGLVEHLIDVKLIAASDGKEGDLLELSEKYEDLNKDQIEDLLKKYNLHIYKVEINEMLMKLSEKSKKLGMKLEKLRYKWIRRYYLLQSDF